MQILTQAKKQLLTRISSINGLIPGAMVGFAVGTGDGGAVGSGDGAWVGAGVGVSVGAPKNMTKLKNK